MNVIFKAQMEIISVVQAGDDGNLGQGGNNRDGNK